MRGYFNLSVGTTTIMLLQPHKARTSFAVANMSAVDTVYIGTDTELTASNGFPIRPGTQMTFNSGNGDNTTIGRYIIASAGTVDVRVLEEYGGE
ncbi:MAG: hypothetical protein WC372_08745 [Candidatus Neomarinimicrobiota bacterium]|jgi:hypothetical protein